MKQEKDSEFQDTINLDEIKNLLTDDAPSEEKPVEQEPEGAEEQKNPGKKKDQEPKGLAYELYCMLHDVIYLLAAVTLIFVFVVRLVGVDGDSMFPTLHNHDYLLLESNFLYGSEDLERGDIVVLSVPYFKDRGDGPIVKRIIATEGQTVDIDGSGDVYVDGVLQVENYINSPTYNPWSGADSLSYPVVVPEDCIFVMGDNRGNSMDSRFAGVGMIDQECVLGKVCLILLPGQTTDSYGQAMEPRDWSRIGRVSE